MASANSLNYLIPLGIGSVAWAGLSVLHIDFKTVMTNFATGPGRTSRLLLAFFVVTNWKNMPFAWTFRVFGAIVRQYALRPAKLAPSMLFHYSITQSHTPLLETDYNMHKSNSTYFSDLDVARSHCVSHLFRDGMKALANNATTKCVMDKEGCVIKGGMGIGLGAVFCSFKKEVAPYQGYEMWTRVLAWDRKWVYLLTHFVVKGKVKPTAWDNGKCGPVRVKRIEDGKEDDFQKYVIATAVSKYVFKVGRFTVHPSILIEQSGMLPERTGEGWRGGPNEVGTDDDLDDVNGEGQWDWKMVESQRRKGMECAEHFAALDGANGLFDGGEEGSLGRFSPG